MTTDFISRTGNGFTHRKGARFSYMSAANAVQYTRPQPLEPRAATGYNQGSKSKSFRDVAVRRPRSPLDPLLEGKSVTLRMSVPDTSGKKRVGERKPFIVVIVPGSLIGSTSDVFLVSVIGRGSAVVSPRRSPRTGSLILSGVPPRLASALMDEFRRILHD